jgi:hypothetical protein
MAEGNSLGGPILDTPTGGACGIFFTRSKRALIRPDENPTARGRENLPPLFSIIAGRLQAAFIVWSTPSGRVDAIAPAA